MGHRPAALGAITIVAVGAKRAGWTYAAQQQYCERLRHWQVAVAAVKPGRGPRALADEAKRMRAKVAAGTQLVALRAGAAAPTTEQFAARLDSWLAAGKVAFAIGGAAGLDPKFCAAADDTLSLAALTMSHELARIVLLEQLYRCAALRSGHPYHRS